MRFKSFLKLYATSASIGLAIFALSGLCLCPTIASAEQAPTQTSIAPWMQSRIDATLLDYKNKVGKDFLTDRKSIGGGMDDGEKVGAYFQKFATEKAPPFQQQILAIIKDKKATMTSDAPGTGYKNHQIRFLWAKNEKGEEVTPPDNGLVNDAGLKFLSYYGTKDGTSSTPKLAFFTDNQGTLLYAFEEFYNKEQHMQDYEKDLQKLQEPHPVTDTYQKAMEKMCKNIFKQENGYKVALSRLKEGKISYLLLKNTGSGHGHVASGYRQAAALLPAKDAHKISGNLTFQGVKSTSGNIEGPWQATYTDDHGKEWTFEVIVSPASNMTYKQSAPCPFSGYQLIPNAKAYMDSNGGKFADLSDIKNGKSRTWRQIAVDHPELFSPESDDLPLLVETKEDGNRCFCTYTTNGQNRIVVMLGKLADDGSNKLIN